MFNTFGRNSIPALAVLYVLLAAIAYAIIALTGSEMSPVLLELVKAAPFGASAFVVGVFSVLFWALNYISRNHKSQLKIQELELRYKGTFEAIDLADKQCGMLLENREKLALKLRAVFQDDAARQDLQNREPELLFDYSEVARQVLRRG